MTYSILRSGRVARLIAGLIVAAATLFAQQGQPGAPGERAQSGPPESGGRGRSGRGGGRGGQLGGAAAGFIMNPVVDVTPPELPADLKSGGILIYSKTSGFREEAGVQASDVALAVIAKERGWPYFVTENAAVVSGPADHPLPRLPIEISQDGYLRAKGDFPAPVGPGFWEHS